MRRTFERTNYLRGAVYFALLPAGRKADLANQWLAEQGVERPWMHRLQVLVSPTREGDDYTLPVHIHDYLSSVYAFFDDQATLAVHFKLLWC